MSAPLSAHIHVGATQCVRPLSAHIRVGAAQCVRPRACHCPLKLGAVAAFSDPNKATIADITGLGFYVNQMTSANASQIVDPRPALSVNQTPVLILRGQDDYLKWDVTHEYKKTFPNATLVYIEAAGHAIDLEQPDAYVTTVRAFLLDQPLPLPAHEGAAPPTS